MTDIYLTEEKKKEYMHDFDNHVLKYNHIEEWTLENGLGNVLSTINRNSNIQSLYSKKALLKNLKITLRVISSFAIHMMLN
jgi:hypothetical protein